MRASMLISTLADLITEYGDMDVEIELLTDKDSYKNEIHYADVYSKLVGDSYQASFVITHDFEDVKEFKKNLK
jgi:hypothetical protein